MKNSARYCLLLAATALLVGACDSGGDTLVALPDAAPADTTLDTGGVDTAVPDISNDTADTTGKPDINTTCPGAPGCVCLADKDCPGSACLATEAGRRCAGPCMQGNSCQTGYLCQSVTASDTKTYKLCVRRFVKLCDPCSQSLTCKTLTEPTSHCVSVGNDKGASGYFCASECTTVSDCPDGYLCASTAMADGSAPANHCIPSDGKCVCSKLAQEDGLKTTCYVSAKDAQGSMIGVCNGARMCTKDGLQGCTAQTPTVEVCNGKDDDCDGKTDETWDCDDKDACTDDKCGGASGCQHLSVGKKCDDGQFCTGDSCDPKLGCQHTALTIACDDKDACTGDDVCGNNKCAGSKLNCDDNNVCTTDSCDKATGCAHVANTLVCDDGNACTLDDVCAKSVCAGPTKKACDDGNGCTSDGCDMAKGCTTADADGTACNDGDACTSSDVCSGGKCAGSTVNCDDSKPCTLDSCDKTSGCVHKSDEGAPCQDGNACTVGDVCKDAACLPGAPTNCDDNNQCTTDTCDKKTGLCSNTNLADLSPCDDGSICTLVDVCTAGQCGGTAMVCDDKNACTEDFCDPKTGCGSKVLTGTACDDKQECTGDGICKNGLCSSGTALINGTPCGGGSKACTAGKCL